MALSGAGLRVPPFSILPAERITAHLWEDEECLRALAQVFDELSVAPFTGIAVRSSATVEDSATSSCAGVFDTVFVREQSAVPSAVKQVLESATYMKDESGASPAMAVVLQAAVAPKMAGVLFSTNPRAPRYGTFYVEAVLGPGSGLVDGSKLPSRFEVDVLSGEATDSVASSDGPEVLGASLAQELRDAMLRMEEALGAPVDIEWAVDSEGPWLLQARPVTALAAHEALYPPFCATSWFFDQRFAEPIRPLTRTSLLPLIAQVAITDALSMRGHPAPEEPLHFYGGQAYVAHETYHAMLDGAPHWFLHPDLRQLFPKHCSCPPDQSKSAPFLHYAWCALASVLQHWRDVFFNGAAWKRFHHKLETDVAEMPLTPPESEAAWREQWQQLTVR